MSYNELVWGMPYRDMIGLRDARLEQYEEERKQMEADSKRAASQNIRNTIMAR